MIDPAVENVINGEVVDTGHRGDLALDPGVVHDEEGLDQVAWGEAMFPDETPQRLGATAAAGAEKLMLGHGGKTNGGM